MIIGFSPVRFERRLGALNGYAARRLRRRPRSRFTMFVVPVVTQTRCINLSRNGARQMDSALHIHNGETVAH
ncbi:MAG TPA: hypothetical protein VNR51_03205 [Hyphomicrobium sp.]|nr:hypothetical protein [Hyphomicrobium sp.]